MLFINFFNENNSNINNPFFNDGDVVILKNDNNMLYSVNGLGREENINFPNFASYKLTPINLNLNLKFKNYELSSFLNNSTKYFILKCLFILNKFYKININNYVKKDTYNKLNNININDLTKIGKINGKYEKII
jgi:hypothetical protein